MTSRDDNLGTQIQPRPTPAPVQEERPPAGAFLGEDTVPLHDAAARELERERDERIRVVLGRRRRPRLPRGRAALTIGGALGLLAMGAAIAAATGGGDPAPSPEQAKPTAAVPHGSPALALGTRRHPIATASVAQARRRAALRARKEAARRRARRHDRHKRKAARRQARAEAAHRQPAKSTRAAVQPSPPSVEAAPPAAEPATPAIEEAPAAEPAEVPVEAPAQPSPEAAQQPAPATSSSATPAESEFGFEK